MGTQIWGTRIGKFKRSASGRDTTGFLLFLTIVRLRLGIV